MGNIFVHVVGNKWLCVDTVYEETSDEGVFTFDDLNFEVFWDYDGDESWCVVDVDVALLLEIAGDQLIER